MPTKTVIYPLVNPPHYMCDKFNNLFLNLITLIEKSEILLTVRNLNEPNIGIPPNDIYNVMLSKSNSAAISDFFLSEYRRAEKGSNFVNLTSLQGLYNSQSNNRWFFNIPYNEIGSAFIYLFQSRPYLKKFIEETTSYGIDISTETLSSSKGWTNYNKKETIVEDVRKYFADLLFPVEPLQMPKKINLTYHYFE